MNAYGYLHNYDQPVYTPDFNFINAALTFKQGKIDANRQKLQSVYDQFSILKVSKDVDQEYIDSRLNQVKDIANKYRNVDFSDDAFAASMMNTVTQVLDDKVKNAVLSTKRMQAEDAAWAQLKEKNPDKYAELNHQYAMTKSDRQRYLSTQEAGDMYGGGANTIEYRDLSKKIMENMPKLQEMLKAKLIQTADGGGYFRYQDTYEYVDPNQLRGALDLLFDEKDRQQMGINAWGTFGQLPDTQLKEVYNSKFVPEIEAHEDKIADLRTLISTTKDPKKLEVYEKELEATQERFTMLQARDFDSIVKVPGGKEQLYTQLYKEDYIGGIVQTYSAPRLVDRDIDKVHQASVEFGQKLDEFEESKRQFNAKQALAEAKFKAEGQKSSGVQDTLAGMGEVGVIGLGLKTLDYQNTLQETMELKTKEEDEAIKGFENLFGAKPSVSNYGKIVKEFGDLETKLEAGGTVTLFGKQVTVTKENYQNLLKFKNNILDDSPTAAKLGQWANDVTLNTVENLAKLVVNSTEFGGKGSDIHPYDLPNFTWKFDEKMQKVATKDGNHYYVHLLKKVGQKGFDNLAKNEQATLKAYAAAQAIGDKNDLPWSEAQREQYFRSIKKDLVNTYGVPGSTLRDTFSNRKQIEAAFSGSEIGRTSEQTTRLTGQAGVALVQIGIKPVPGFNLQASMQGRDATLIVPNHVKDDVKQFETLYSTLLDDPSNQDVKQQVTRLQQKIKQKVAGSQNYVKTKKVGQDFFLSEMTSADTEYYNKQGREVALESFYSVFNNANVQAEAALKDYAQTLNALSYTPPTYTPDSPKYNALIMLAQQNGANIKAGNKDGVTVEPDINPDGTYGDKVKLFYAATQKGITSRAYVEVSMKELQDNLNIKFTPLEKSPYDIRLGSSAKPILMGVGNFKTNPRDAFRSNFDALAREISKYDDDGTLSSIAVAYTEGKLKFALEPGEGGVYLQTVRDQSDQLLGTFPTEDTKFTYNAVTQLQSNSSTFASEIFTNFVTKAIEEKKELIKLKQMAR
jgi:hypothetical protein